MGDDDAGKDRWLFLNDWPQRRFLAAAIALLVLLVCFSALRALAGNISILNYIGYVFVPFLIVIPGAAALRLMRVHGLDLARSGLYSVALGVFFLMMLGFGLNFLHYIELIKEPLSFEFLSIAYPSVLLALVAISLKRDSKYVAPNVQHSLDMGTMVVLALSIALPILAGCAAKMIGFDGDRTIMLYVLTLACFTPLVILSHRTRHYELLIFSLSLAILFHRALMTNYLMGYDIFSEYTAATITTNNGWWNISESAGIRGGGANTALSIVALGPVLSNLTSIQTVELLKMVYPFIFSFVPLMLYKAIEGQFNPKVALLGATLFIGYHGFFNLMTQLGKQEIAELFLVAMVLVLTDKLLRRFDKRLLVGIFLIGVAVSHYSIAYMVMAVLAALFGLQLLAWVVRSFRDWWAARERPSFLGWIKGTALSYARAQLRQHIITFEMVLLFVIMFYAWYDWAANGLMLNVISTGQTYIDPSATSSSTSLSLSQMDAIEYLFIDYSSPLHNSEKYLLLLTQVLTIFGVLFMWVKGKAAKGKMDDEFLFLGMIGAIILIAAYIVPNLSLSFYHGRFFQFTQIFLCGFLAIGIYAILYLVRQIVRNLGFWKAQRRVDIKKITLIIGTVLMVLFLSFNTGIIYRTVSENSFNVSLDESMSGSVYSDSDVVTAKWLSNETHLGAAHTMADYHRFPVLAGQQMFIWNLKYQFTANDTDSFVYLSGWNNKWGYVYPLNTAKGASLSYTPQEDVLKQVGGAYDLPYSSSGKSTVIYIPPGEPVTNPPGPGIYDYEDSPKVVVPAIVIALFSLAMVAWVTGLYAAHRNKLRNQEI